ncbi:tetratricopeptide repeat protein [Hymenobacter gummosus]|uniref:tetratricopeptide repeat protein n=1 Tax=Hymenobacter gummosus TaxID=1776032 RepID=UPI001404E120|nr:tetratricopeptide repeat protein [Hymenobacter gummosus]
MPHRFMAGALLLAALLGSRPLHAQSQSADAAAKHQAVVAIYPVMLQAVQARNLTQARTLCQQAISYEPRDPTHRYNLACIEALSGAPDAAFAALNQATALGYADPSSLNTDADLAAVRTDARFATVLQAAARNAGGTAAPAPTATVRPVGPRPAAARPAPAAAPAAAAPRPATRPGAVAQPLVGKVTGNRPVGLFLMTRYWIATGSLEKGTYYFTPDGRVYVNPTGFSAAELAAQQPNSRGTFQVSGNTLTVSWASGQKSSSPVEDAKGDAFNWDMGIFVGAQPFRNTQQLLGTFEGGNSASTGSGYIAAVGTYTFRADGTYARSGVASSTSVSDGSVLKTGGQGQTAGRWQLNGFVLTLTDNQGRQTSGVSFPFVTETSAAKPDRIYFAGTLYKRQ